MGAATVRTKKKCGFVPQLPTIIFNCTEQRRTKRGSVLDFFFKNVLPARLSFAAVSIDDDDDVEC